MSDVKVEHREDCGLVHTQLGFFDMLYSHPALRITPAGSWGTGTTGSSPQHCSRSTGFSSGGPPKDLSSAMYTSEELEAPGLSTSKEMREVCPKLKPSLKAPFHKSVVIACNLNSACSDDEVCHVNIGSPRQPVNVGILFLLQMAMETITLSLSLPVRASLYLLIGLAELFTVPVVVTGGEEAAPPRASQSWEHVIHLLKVDTAL